MNAAKVSNKLTGKVNKRLQDFRSGGRKAKTIKIKLDNYDKLEGPVHVIAWTKPPRGKMGEKIYDAWAYSDEFSFSLHAGQAFPLSVRAFRYPMSIGDKVFSKETKAYVNATDPNSWTEEAYIRGSEDCSANGYCVHAETTDYTCPRSIDMPGGIILNGDKLYLLREDGPLVPIDDVEQARKDEVIKNDEINAKLGLHQSQMQGRQPFAYPSKPFDPPAMPLAMGSSGPVEDAIGPRTGA